MKNRVFSLTLVLVLVLGMLTFQSACAEEKLPPLEITMINRVDAVYSSTNNPVLKAIEEAANVKLDIEFPPINNYMDRLNIVMASGDMPDIIHIQSLGDGSYTKWAEEGLIIPIDEYLAQAPDIVANTVKAQSDQAIVASTGKMHAFVRPHAANSFCGVVRLDWLENVGLEIPSTLEEFTAVMEAFTFKDPDKNGKNDTYGMSLTTLNPTEGGNSDSAIFLSAFDIRREFMPDADGKVTIMEAQPGYLVMMDYFRDMYAKGVIDPEWYTNIGNAERDKFKAGKIGIDTLSEKPVTLFEGDVLLGVTGAFPEAKLDMIMPLENAEGKRSLGTNAATWGAYAISSTAKDVDRIVEFINWCFAEEGRLMMNTGVQGLTFESRQMNDDVLANLTFTGDQHDNYTKYASKYMSFITAIDGLRLVAVGETPEQQKAYVDYEVRYATEVDITYTPSMNVLPSYMKLRSENPELLDKLKQVSSKYIVGEISRGDFEAFLNDSYLPAYADVLVEMQSYYDENLK
jgi:ABC-type sugar transport system, periplasmic component